MLISTQSTDYWLIPDSTAPCLVAVDDSTTTAKSVGIYYSVCSCEGARVLFANDTGFRIDYSYLQIPFTLFKVKFVDGAVAPFVLSRTLS